MTPLLALALAVAAPVPKADTAGKLKELYGEVADPDSKCTCELTSDRALRIAVPHEQNLLILDHHILPPIHTVKKVEGDFELVVRVAHAPQKSAEKKKDSLTNIVAVSAGIAITGSGGPKESAVFVRYHRKKGDGWASGFVHYTNHPKGSNGHDTGDSKYDEAPAWLRLTRLGDTITSEFSADDKKWNRVGKHPTLGMGKSVKVGPVAFQSTDSEFIATFDQYEIKPLTEEKK